MQDTLSALILLLLAFGGIVVRKTYFRVPVRELKRRAQQHDDTAKTLYRAAAYGNSLRALLVVYIGLTGAGGLILLIRALSVWAALLLVVLLLWAAILVVPAGRTSRFGVWLTVIVTPFVAWLLNYLHPLLGRGADVIERRKPPQQTKIYERDDLIKLIERQLKQDDSRLTNEELEIARHALSFEDERVADIMTPRKQVKTVLASDTVGPVFINELHESGQQQILVRESAKGAFVGSLSFSRLGLKSKGTVQDSMDRAVYYVHESDSLGEALHAFFVTNYPLFAVVNSAEEYVGVVSVESMLRRLVGHLPGDDFDQYTDIEAVAARHPRIRKTREVDFDVDDIDAPSVKTEEEVIK